MRQSARHSLRRAIIAAAVLAAGIGVGGIGGCNAPAKPEPKPIVEPRHPNVGLRKDLPAFMKGTIHEAANVDNKDPYLVSGFGLVVGLEGTGNNTGVPLAVRNHMIDEMVRHGMGSLNGPMADLKPERVINDPNAALVEVYAFIPPGAREGQRCDVLVQAVTGSETRSLAKGMLYDASLFKDGADPLNPKGKIHSFVKARGDVFVNPGSWDAKEGTSAATTLRTGTILGGGTVLSDRPIWLRVRTPQLSLARAMEFVIDQRFQSDQVARTQDEGVVFLFVPRQYNGDWEHFMGVVRHLYLNTSPGFKAMKAKELAEEAVKPDAPLSNISYAFEGLGDAALPYLRPLYANGSGKVAFSAARAGAFIGDPTAIDALGDIAEADGHAFQLQAVQVLGSMTPSTRITRMLSMLLSKQNALVRIAAYEILIKHGAANNVLTKKFRGFTVDRVFGGGPPLIYATRSGEPRIALFGDNLRLNTPMVFNAMDDRFTIAAAADNRMLTIFDRTKEISGRQARIAPDLIELVMTLGGPSEQSFRFSYAELVGVLKSLSESKHTPAAFVLQDLPALQEAIEEAPPIVEPDGTTAAIAPLPQGAGSEKAPALGPEAVSKE
jgi:hypothetical protein